MVFVWSKRGDYQNCSVLYCIRQLCTIISTLDEQFLQFSGLGFVTLGAFLCIFFHTAYMLCYCQHSRVDLMGLKPGP